MIMKERLDVIFFQVLTPCVRRAAPQPAARWTSTKPHSCAILTRSRTLFVPKGKYSGRSARPEPRIGLHWHYCAGSMVKFKLGWLVKVRGAFCSVCRGGRSPSLISLCKTRHWSRAVTASTPLHSATKNVPDSARLWKEITALQIPSYISGTNGSIISHNLTPPNPSAVLHYLKHTQYKWHYCKPTRSLACCAKAFPSVISGWSQDLICPGQGLLHHSGNNKTMGPLPSQDTE